jgi:putative selenate reductase
MAVLVPQSLEELMRRMYAEHARSGAIYDLEAREIWRGASAVQPGGDPQAPRLDLSVTNHGARAATGVGPAAGPHAQLAQNILLSWLAGARVLELKTVQILDRLEIARPCIDAMNVGFNVEWSQELTLEESLREYVHGAILVHAAADLLGMQKDARETLLDVSVGYSLDGICADPVRRWLDRLRHAAPLVLAARRSLPKELARRIEHVEVPDEIYDCVTLSTFHGCPADEIERIVTHLYEQHDVHVIVKMNPTLLGFDTVSEILRGRLGYDDLVPIKEAFDEDLRFEDAVAMMGRLEKIAAKKGRTLGAKFTNTLVVKNHKSFFPKEQQQMYLSGQPLHVLAVQAACRFAEATGGRFPLSFSAGIDRHNFPDALACGFVPVTTCTDLLRPGGYARLPKYLKELEARMRAANVANVPDFIASIAKARGGHPSTESEAALSNLRAYARAVLEDPRYASEKNKKIPRRIGSHLALFDCINCDKCVQVCPNDANFSIDVPAATFEAPDLVVTGGKVHLSQRPPYVVKKERQFANYADFCNDCGNCDVFCPEEGGPYKIKPRFFGERTTFEREGGDGFYVERTLDARDVITGRIDGLRHELSLDRARGRAYFSDGVVYCEIDLEGHKVLGSACASHAIARNDGHTLPLWRYHAMRLLLDGVLAGINPVSARFLGEVGSPDGAGRLEA